jgi:cell division septation protein DedD
MGNIRTLCRSAIVIVTWNGFSALATVYDSDGSSTNVQYTHDMLAQDGDTIALPVGTFTWTTQVTISKGITLQGAGIGQTIVKDNIHSASVRLLDISLKAGLVTRVTGIEFQDGGRTPTPSAPNGVIVIGGSNTNGAQLRFDHNKWVDMNGFLVTFTVIGVIDHNDLNIGGHVYEWLYPYGSGWNGKQWGDGSWDSPVNWGSGEFLFLEDNTGNCTRTSIECSLTDGFNGARFVVRHNTLSNFNIGDHGTESPGRGRSSRAKEIYNNVMDARNVNRFPVGTRGGTTLFHDNTLTHYQGAGALNTLSAFRMVEDFNPWGGADGRNGWDKNNAGNPFTTFTATSVTLPRIVTVAGNPWTPGQWVGYTLHRTAGANTDYGYIDGNTANSITYRSGGFGRDMVPAVGDTYEINKVEQSLDQAGAGQSSVISSSANPTPPPGFTQAADPCYSWNNTNDGAAFNNFSPDTSNIKPGVNFFNNTAKPGYTEYVYPHPLVSDPPVPSPTPTATVTPSSTPTPTPTPSPTSPPSPTPTATTTATPTPQPSSTPSPTVTPTATPTPTPRQITLGARGYLLNGRRRADLSWSGATSNRVDLYRNGVLIATPTNGGFYTDRIGGRVPGSFTYQVCNTGTQTCSNQATVTF